MYKYLERSTRSRAANEMSVGTWSADRADFPLIDPGIFIGTNDQRPWACAWGHWRNDPTDPNGEEPPEGTIWTIWDIWDKCAVEADYEKRRRLFWDILDIWKQEIPMPTFLGEWPSWVVQKNALHNYVEGYMNSWLSHGKSFPNSSHAVLGRSGEPRLPGLGSSQRRVVSQQERAPARAPAPCIPERGWQPARSRAGRLPDGLRRRSDGGQHGLPSIRETTSGASGWVTCVTRPGSPGSGA